MISTPLSRNTTRLKASSKGTSGQLAPGGVGNSWAICAHTWAPTSGAGTSWRRTRLGSARIVATHSSARIPGTSQSKPSGARRPSTSTGTWTLTPSSGWPGSNT